jgi:hypothetical protein
MLYLATDRPALFDQLRGLIAEIVPNIGRLEVRTGGGQLRVVFDTAASCGAGGVMPSSRGR